MATFTEGPEDPQTTEITPATFSPPELGATTPLPRAAPTMATPVAPQQTQARRSGLTWKIFFAVAGTVGLVLVVTLAVSQVQSSRAAETSIHNGLLQTAGLIHNQLDDGADNLTSVARIYVSAPQGIKGVFERSGDSTRKPDEAATDTSDYFDAAHTMAEELGAAWVQIADRNGVRLARSDQPGAQPRDLTGSPLIAHPLAGTAERGFGVASDSVLFQAVSVPVFGAAARSPIGVAMVVRNIGDSTAVGIQRVTGSDIVFFAIDSMNRVRIVGTTPRLGDRQRTAGALTSLIMAAHPAGSAPGMGQVLDDMKMDNAMGSTEAKDNTIDGHTYVWTVKPLKTADSTTVGGVVALRDKDEALAPFKRLQFFVLMTGLIALLVAFIIASAVARQITQPIRILVDATRRAAEGDYAAEIPKGTGEIGALSEAFNQLLEDLREKQSLVDFLQGPSSGSTVQAQAQRMSMDRAAAPRGGGQVATLEAGSTLANRYEIKRVLGAGGMGMVYKAVDKELGETVAIKTLRPEIMNQDPAALDRFRSEIRLARRISHRNVVRTHDIGESDGLYFITMEFVEGSSLKDLIISRGRLPAAAVISIGKQLCRALEVAHEAGVIHRDIKPQNMVVEADGTVKVMDFGIARLQMRSEGHTQAGMVVGTPEYMSPEQLRGDELDARADLYSAGVVLYESLTGKLPHIADTPGALIGKVLSETPAPPRASVAEVSPALSAVIMQALSKDREQRPRTALEFLALLERA